MFEDDSTLSTASSPVITCFIFLSFQQLLAYQNNQLPQSSNVEMIIDDFIVNTEARISVTSLVSDQIDNKHHCIKPGLFSQLLVSTISVISTAIFFIPSCHLDAKIIDFLCYLKALNHSRVHRVRIFASIYK